MRNKKTPLPLVKLPQRYTHSNQYTQPTQQCTCMHAAHNWCQRICLFMVHASLSNTAPCYLRLGEGMRSFALAALYRQSVTTHAVTSKLMLSSMALSSASMAASCDGVS